jgi:spore coat protein U-like protein
LGLCAVASGLTAAAGAAGTNSTTFNVQATIDSACNLSAADLNFGTYNPGSGAPLDMTSTVNVFCTVGTTYTLALDIGTGGGAYTARNIASGGNTLSYNLYTSTSRTTVWGDGTGSTVTVSGAGLGLLTADTKTVYGRIAASQDKPPGTYTSTVTVTVNFS